MRQMQKVSLAVFVSLGIALVAGIAQAGQICISIDGSEMQFSGETTQKGCEGKILGLSFQYTAVLASQDPRSFQVATIKKPTVRIKKAWGAASPQLFNALVKNKSLRSVMIDFIAKDETGRIVPHHSFKLTDAVITLIEQQAEEVMQGQSVEMELVEFTGAQIEFIDHKSGNKAKSQ